MDQTRHIAKTQDYEYVDSEMIALLSKVHAFCEEGHTIMDCLFVPFQIKACITKHLELQNAARTLINQP